ncbi:NACHT domain-containing protein [Plantactinospora sp. S1510]|uniref:NACHT domain-containing protein n=1 Tax=Plantactinospora alkalitolerans TaxID=2789879 RepID=A0ABS0GSV7_9ACTN|nr:NACHT domain-containing protein [Plantactinospora alkalitolerans]
MLQLGRAVVVPAATCWLRGRRERRERAAPLTELLHQRITDEFSRRRAEREIEAVVDEVAARLQPLIATRFAGLTAPETNAALAAVADTFTETDLSDDAVFGADVDPARLAGALRAADPDRADRAGLSADARRLYDVALDDCCRCLVQLVTQVTPFSARAEVELLARTTGLAGRLDGLADQVRQVLDRLPVNTSDTPAGVDQDEEFLRRYLTRVADKLDDLELFGVDVRRFRPRTTLSVAYISLAVTADRRTARRHPVRWDPGALRHAQLTQAASVRVEQALGERGRTLVRGEAGAGKSTLLRWLAVTAARSGFTGALADWNGRVPFLVKLRSHAGRSLPRPEQFLTGVADPIVALMPAGWVHRQFAAGRVMLLVDGVDELPDDERRNVRSWLRDLLGAYPGQRVVVTSRPAAAAARWLDGEGFGSAALERMTPPDVRALVRHWHEATRDAGSLPCPAEELPRYESALLARLDGSPHLQQLAASPLLCAMLCALNLDRDTHLPPDRMGIYQATVDMLLDRRDTERGVPVALPGLTARDRLQLLQDVAWRLSINTRSELPATEAAAGLGQRLAGMPRLDAAPEAVLDHLVQRSGVVRSPVPGRIDFVHRTFQEYLTAREIAEQGHIGFLVGQAHLDSWREVVVMTAGHANLPLRSELIKCVLDRAGREPRHQRTLTLLAAACLETLPGLDPPELLTRLRTALARLLPPRGRAEVRSLAAVGESLLDQLPTGLAGLSEGRAAATVRTAALVNGPRALDVLSRYAADPRRAVQRELAQAWEYFDPDEYVDRVLGDAPLDNGAIEIRRAGLLPAARRLAQARSISVNLAEPVALECLTQVPTLTEVFLQNGWHGHLATLAACEDLRSLMMWATPTCELDQSQLTAVSRLAALRSLQLVPFDNRFTDLTPLAALVDLSWLSITAAGVDLTPVVELPSLQYLYLNRCQDVQYERLRDCKNLSVFGLLDVQTVPGGLAGLVDVTPQVGGMFFNACDWIDDLTPLVGLPELRSLYLYRTPRLDFGTLAALPDLVLLTLGQQPTVDLTALTALPHLRTLTLTAVDTPVDLAPLAQWPGLRLVVHLDREQATVNAELVGPNVRIRRE